MKTLPILIFLMSIVTVNLSCGEPRQLTETKSNEAPIILLLADHSTPDMVKSDVDSCKALKFKRSSKSQNEWIVSHQCELDEFDALINELKASQYVLEVFLPDKANKDIQESTSGKKGRAKPNDSSLK